MNRFRSFDWLAIVFYPLAVVLMEAFWVYPWLVWLGGWPVFSERRPALSLAAVIIVLAASLLVTRVMSRQKWPMRYIQGVVIGGGLVVILLVLGIEYGDGYGYLSGGWFNHIGQVLGNTLISANTIVVALPVLLYLWWRGILLGQTTSYFKDVYRSFLLGMVALIVLIIFWQISSGAEKFEPPGPGIGLNVIAFFFFGLLAITVCHLYTMRSSMPKEEAALSSVKRWLPVTLGVVGGMVAISIIVASIFSEEFFDSVGRGAGIFFSFLGKIFNVIMIPFNYLFDALYWILRYIVERLRNTQTMEPNASGNMTFPGAEEFIPTEIPPVVTDIFRWLVVALIVSAIVFILAKAISRFRNQRAREEIEEIHESLWSWRGLKDDLGLLFGMMRKKFQRKRSAALPKYDIDDDGTRRLSIREVYRRLLWEARRSGLARHPQETASEYADRLEGVVPDSDEPLDRLTELYVEVRYGEASPPEQQVDNANVVWRFLRGLLRGMRGD